MKQRTHRRIFWAAVIGSLCGIAAFTQVQSWAAVGMTATCAVLALFAGETGKLYEKEGER